MKRDKVSENITLIMCSVLNQIRNKFLKRLEDWLRVQSMDLMFVCLLMVRQDQVRLTQSRGHLVLQV